MSTSQQSDAGPLYRTSALHTGGVRGSVQVDGKATFATESPLTESADGNPEQFLAMAWSTCLNATVQAVLRDQDMENRSAVEVSVELHRESSGEYFFQPAAEVSIEGMSREESLRVAERAHSRCPVSKLLRGQRAVTVDVVEFRRG